MVLVAVSLFMVLGALSPLYLPTLLLIDYKGIARALWKLPHQPALTVAAAEAELELELELEPRVRAARIVVLQRDFRDAELPAGMTPNQWVKQVVVTALRPLGIGTHEVDLIMPRWMQREYVGYNSWRAPGKEALPESNMHVVHGTYVYENSYQTALLQFLRITIEEDDTIGGAPRPTHCAGLWQVVVVVNRPS